MSRKMKDITGMRSGKLVAIEPTKERYHCRVVWLCKCDCGKTRKVCGEHIKLNKTKHCGCSNRSVPNKYEFVDDLCMIELCDRDENIINYTIIDKEDYPLVKKFRWHYSNRGYVVSSTSVYLHTIIMGEKKGFNYIDGNLLNNRKCNLREATREETMRNRGKFKLNRFGDVPSSKYKGVYWAKAGNEWRASIHLNGGPKYLGSFVEEKDAAHAYNKAALKHFKEFARINKI